MWTEETVFYKSNLGKNALELRLPELPIRLRPVLILVDGKRSLKELRRLLVNVGGTLALDELFALKLVVTAEPAATAALGEMEPASTPSAVRLPFLVYALKVRAFFERELGPQGKILYLQLAAAPDMRALKPLIDRGLDNLKYFKGSAVVDQFKNTLGKRAPLE